MVVRRHFSGEVALWEAYSTGDRSHLELVPGHAVDDLTPGAGIQTRRA